MEDLLELRPRTGTHIPLFFQQCEREKTSVERHGHHHQVQQQQHRGFLTFPMHFAILDRKSQLAYSAYTKPKTNRWQQNCTLLSLSLSLFYFFSVMVDSHTSITLVSYYPSLIFPNPMLIFSFSFSIYLTKMKYQYQYYHLCPFFFVCAIVQGSSFQLSNPKSQNQNQNTLFFYQCVSYSVFGDTHKFQKHNQS